jgi:hypothetical protein
MEMEQMFASLLKEIKEEMLAKNGRQPSRNESRPRRKEGRPIKKK